jgi:two-component system sensor histidine kinase PilS (NtrC family)
MAERTAQYSDQLNNVSVVYNIYRIVLPLVLLVTYLSSPGITQLGAVAPTLFVQVSTAYAIFAIITTFFTPGGRRYVSNPKLVASTLIVDILATSLIIYTCGGTSSGLGLLLIVTIASGSILIRGRISTFLAAIATLALIYTELYLSLSLEDPPNRFLQTGILGMILFATSLYLQTVTDRIYKAALLADKQAGAIFDLEKLNNEIIQRMRTGIVVVNPQLEIVSMNSAARTALGPILKPAGPASEFEFLLPSRLKEQLQHWKLNPKRQPEPITIPETKKQLQLNFAFLKPGLESDILIFLEDNRQIVQRVRQMKLASLGRLTASIAHEVRNPLGAISHASQLLRESKSVSNDDRRMIEIILNHCNRVNMIIEDVLDASRHDETSSQKLILGEWLAGFIESYRATHQSCDEIELNLKGSVIEVNVIPGQLEQILNNLFDNGLRYSKTKTGRATLSIEAGVEQKEDDTQAYLHVIDEGPGIDEEAEARLFEPFHTTEATGTGLGLYISKELCEANQSQLVYGRTASGKSCFSIYFSHPERSVA